MSGNRFAANELSAAVAGARVESRLFQAFSLLSARARVPTRTSVSISLCHSILYVVCLIAWSSSADTPAGAKRHTAIAIRTP